jgi:hypothetical protein
MRKRYFPTFLSAIALCGALHAQHGYGRMQYRMLDEARSLVDAGQWEDAYRIYKRLLPLDTAFAEVPYGIGLCETNMPELRDRAAGHFEAAVRNGSLEGKYQLALEYHRQQRFDEEVAQLEEYRKRGGRDMTNEEVDRRLAIARTAKELTAAPVHVRIRNMGAAINSPVNDYCPLVNADGNMMYFTSRRSGTLGGIKDESGQFFEDIYTSERIDEAWTNATNVGRPLNSYMQDATVGLSPDGNEMIIYRASQAVPNGDLFLTQKVQGAWQAPERMTDRINSDAQEPSATISPDGSEIYFSSDRPGGFGGRDLYRIRRLPNGEWSLPLNLGPNINTANDEDAPFMHSDGTTLFFSSNGHNTMGGYDIFKASLTDPDMNVWDTPENMGSPLNTVNDDIFFCLSADGRTGYFSSERPGGLGGQDIYQVVFPTSQIDYMLVRGIATDPTDGPVKARITLTDEKGQEIVGVYNTNEATGRYVMAVKPGTRYHMLAEAYGFDTWKYDLTTPDDGSTQEMALDITLVRNDSTARNIPTQEP